MNINTATFEVTPDEYVRVTYTEGVGVLAQLGAMEDGVFVPTREADTFLFEHHPEFIHMYTPVLGWSRRIVASLLFDMPHAAKEPSDNELINRHTQRKMNG